jgi:hypothetical protein
MTLVMVGVRFLRERRDPVDLCTGFLHTHSD